MSKDCLRALQDYCIGTAESEETFIQDVFVDDGQFLEIVRVPLGSPTFLIGRKGTGKSVILKWIASKSKTSKVHALYLKPDDMPLLDGVGNAEDIATIKRHAFSALVNATAASLGATLKGLLGRNDKKLFDKAISSGLKDQDSIQSLARFLAKFGTEIAEIDFKELIPSTTATSQTPALIDAVKTNLSKKNRIFFLLIDDVDQVAAPSQSNQLNRIWGFILAVKKLAEALPNMKCIVSMRTEIWYLLLNDDRGQRDQIDHIRPLIREIDPEIAQIKRIVDRRLEVVANNCLGGQSYNPFQVFFEGDSVTLPSSTETRSWSDFISKTARNRPRDAIQFLGHLAKTAIARNLDLVNNAIVDEAMQSFSEDRVDDIAREYAGECSDIKIMLKTFYKIQFRGSDAEAVKAHLSTIPGVAGIRIRGRLIHGGNNDDIFALWKFLHEIGFINPCVPDNTQTRNFRHITYRENNGFVSFANWNEMQKALWEVHPAYRSYLIKIAKDESARSGIPLSSLLSIRKKPKA